MARETIRPGGYGQTRASRYSLVKLFRSGAAARSPSASNEDFETIPMTTASTQLQAGHLSTAWRAIPPLMRVLFVTNRQRTGGWLAEAFSAENASKVQLEEVVGSAAGVARLREETYDAILLSHHPPELNALELAEGCRAGGADEPIVVLGLQSEQEMAAACFERGADGYACASTTTSRNLVWTIARAVRYHQLIRENHRLSLAEHQRLQREHDEAEKLLSQQRALLGDLEAIQQRETPGIGPLDDGAADSGQVPIASPALPKELILHYRELLRAYVIMGSGNIACELNRLAGLLARAGVSARQTMQLHLLVVEELVAGLGARSARHIMNRADLLAMELMVHLAENYRIRYRERIHPPAQQMLPGFENS